MPENIRFQLIHISYEMQLKKLRASGAPIKFRFLISNSALYDMMEAYPDERRMDTAWRRVEDEIEEINKNLRDHREDLNVFFKDVEPLARHYAVYQDGARRLGDALKKKNMDDAQRIMKFDVAPVLQRVRDCIDVALQQHRSNKPMTWKAEPLGTQSPATDQKFSSFDPQFPSFDSDFSSLDAKAPSFEKKAGLTHPNEKRIGWKWQVDKIIDEGTFTGAIIGILRSMLLRPRFILALLIIAVLWIGKFLH